MPAVNPIHVLEFSAALRTGYENWPAHSKQIYNLTLMCSGEVDAIACDDAIFVGDDAFFINATDDDRFYVRPCLNDPDTTHEEMIELGRQVIADIEAGVPISDIGPKVPSPCYYGQYVATVEEAILLATLWLTTPTENLPKEYHPPVVTPR